MRWSIRSALCATLVAKEVVGIQVTMTDPNSIKSALSTISANLMSYYTGNQPGGIPGYLPQPYYWWECGAMFNSLINYWHFTGDTTYNDIVKQGLLFQASATDNFMPPNQTKDEGNDDQVFWGFAAMAAAEYGFENPAADEPSWLALAQGVFNSQALRWDSADCGGGLRWQIFTWNNGYDYKNAPSNGGLFNLASRLYAYTGNQTYADWAEKAYNWMDAIGLISGDYNVYDGTTTTNNCTTLDHVQWTYSSGMILNGCATMWNVTQDAIWQTRAQAVWSTEKSVFYNDAKVMFEICEPTHNCNTDQQSFKAYLARFMYMSSDVAPFLYDEFQPYLEASAAAAMEQCSGGASGTACGLQWTLGAQYDGLTGVGEQMAAMEIMLSLLSKDSPGPLSAKTGGNSSSDASAGTGRGGNGEPVYAPITTGDRAGAGILTALVIGGFLSGGWFLVS